MANVAQWVERWAGSAGTAQTRYTEGIQATQVDVVGLAVAAQGKMLSGVTEAVQSGRWARRLNEVGTAGWKAASVAKAGNYSTGINAGRDNYQRAMQTWGPIIDSVQAQVRSMPNNSFQDSLNRMTANATLLHNQKLAR